MKAHLRAHSIILWKPRESRELKIEQQGGIYMHVLEFVFLAIGVISTFLGIFQYEFWMNTVPGGGFMPTIMGIILTLFSVLVIVDKKNNKAFESDRKGLIPVVAVIGTLVSNIIFGLIISVVLMIFVWLKYVESQSFKTSLIVTVLTASIAYAIFGLWLRVPFPTGILDIPL